MTLDIDPGNWRNKYHVRLSLGSNETGLILCNGAGDADQTGYSRQPAPVSTLRTYSGSPTYGDLDPFWTPVSQDTWTGGRGNEYLDRNGEAYFDGWGVDTMAGRQFTATGLAVSAYVQRLEVKSQYYSAGRVWGWFAAPLGGAYAFKISATYTVRAVEFTARRVTGAVGNNLTVTLRADAAGSPGAVLATAIVTAAEFTDYEVAQVFRAAFNYAAAGTWWVVIEESGVGDYLILGTRPASGSSGLSKSYSGAWVTFNFDFWGRAIDVAKPTRAWFFELRRVLFAVMDPDDGTGAACYMNGYHDLATGGGSTTIVKAGAGWAVNRWAGAVVRILAATGIYQAQTYRTIVSNTADTLTVSPAWDVLPAAGTEFYICGTDIWEPVAGMPATVHISDVEAVNEIAYMARTADNDLIRLRRVAVAGALTNEWVTEAGNKADQLCSLPGGSGAVMWRSVRNGISVSGTIPDGSDLVGVVGNLVFGAATAVGLALEPITNMLVYDEDQALFVLKAGSAYKIVSGAPVRVNLGELRAVMDERNGAAAVQSNVYLLFSFLDGVERYYKSALDDVGPNLGAGLPAERQGAVTALYAYPGRYYAAVSGGAGKVSAVLCNQGQGWHEVWRAPAAGEAIRSLFVQSVPGQAVDRLWISCGTDVWWVPVAISGWKAMGVDAGQAYRFGAQGYLVSSKINLGVWDVNKFWYSVKVIAQGGGGSGWSVRVDYRTDQQASWTQISGYFDETHNERVVSADYDIYSTWIQLRVRIENTEDTAYTPRVLAVVVKGAARAGLGHVDALVFRLTERGRDLNGQPDGQSAATVLGQLATWAAAAQPVYLEASAPDLDGRWVFLEPAVIKLRSRSVETGEAVYICQVAAREI